MEALQASLLPARHGRQSYADVVGGALRRTYRSASPLPPLMPINRLVAPAGTLNVYRRSLPAAPESAVTGTSFCSSPSPGPGSGSPPPMTAATAAWALMMPAPQPPEHEPGNVRAVLLRIDSTWAGVSGEEAADCISATTPATCGAAIEVPL